MRSATLRCSGAAYRLELRLICLHWGYLLLQLGWAIFVISSYANMSYQSASWLLFSLSLGVIPLVTLAAMLFTGLSASRTTRNRFDRLEAAYPTGAEIILGRWFAVVTAMGGFLIVPMGIALVTGPLDGFLRALPIFLLETLSLFALISALIWLLHVSVGIKRWMYPLFAVIWLGSAIVPAALNVEAFPISLLLAFTAQGWINLNYSLVWGRLALGHLPLFYDLFYLALLTLTICLIIWRDHLRRFYHHAWPIVTLAVVAFGIMLLAGRGYSLVVVEANDQDERQAQFVQAHAQEIALPDEMPYAVAAYDITLDLSDASNPRFHLQMEVVNQGDEALSKLSFSLNNQLEITESSVPYERDGDFVSLALPQALLPGERMAFDLDYQGALWYYDGSFTQGRLRDAMSFIRPGGVNLPCEVAWYPIPGQIVVGRTSYFDSEVERSTPDCLSAQPMSFILHIEHPGDLHFASNLPVVDENTFASSSTTWTQLIGAPELVTEGLGDITLVTVAPLMEKVRPLVIDHFQPALAYLQRFFPDVESLTVFALDSGFGSDFFQTATPAMAGRLVVAVDPFYLSAFPNNPYNEYLFAGQAMINSLFNVGEYVNGRSNGYVVNIGYFLWAHYLANGDPNQMKVILTDGIPQGNVGLRTYSSQTIEEQYPITYLLYDVYVNDGETAVINLIHKIQAEAEMLNTLPAEAVQAWIEDTAHAQ